MYLVCTILRWNWGFGFHAYRQAPCRSDSPVRLIVDSGRKHGENVLSLLTINHLNLRERPTPSTPKKAKDRNRPLFLHLLDKSLPSHRTINTIQPERAGSHSTRSLPLLRTFYQSTLIGRRSFVCSVLFLSPKIEVVEAWLAVTALLERRKHEELNGGRTEQCRAPTTTYKQPRWWHDHSGARTREHLF